MLESSTTLKLLERLSHLATLWVMIASVDEDTLKTSKYYVLTS